VFAAFLAKFLESNFFFDLLFVASGVIVHGFANFAFELDEIFLRHNISD
jgi:hypothetical protein